MKILLVHQNFPGQFRELAPALQQAGHDVRALSVRKESVMAGVHHVVYQPERSSSPQIHPWLVNTETAIIRGQAAAESVQRQAAQGWTPDVVLGHTGWGEMLFMRQVLPHARLLGFNEMYYRDQGGDVGFDPEFPPPAQLAQRLQVRNMHLASSLLACDVGITPTQWQADGFPPDLRGRLRVIHDGIRTDLLTPDPSAWVSLNRAGLVLRQGALCQPSATQHLGGFAQGVVGTCVFDGPLCTELVPARSHESGGLGHRFGHSTGTRSHHRWPQRFVGRLFQTGPVGRSGV